jgi:hypothetical protein
MKLQRLQNMVFFMVGIFPRSTLIRDMHMAFQIPYVNDYITKLCRQEAQVIQNYENAQFIILDKANPAQKI